MFLESLRDSHVIRLVKTSDAFMARIESPYWAAIAAGTRGCQSVILEQMSGRSQYHLSVRTHEQLVAP